MLFRDPYDFAGSRSGSETFSLDPESVPNFAGRFNIKKEDACT